MNCLITGGAGFIGSHLADSLIERGDTVYIIDDLSTGSLKNIKHLMKNKRFHYKIDSIINMEAVKKLIDRCDEIYHLAAAVGVKLIIQSPVKTIETNIKGTEVILELASKKKKKVLISSTSEVYGKSEDVPFREDGDIVLGPTIRSRWSYACSKAIDEFLALAYYQEKGLPIIIARFFNTVGPRQSGRYGMVIPRFVQQALKNEPITVYGDGSQSRCFTYVGDVVKAVIKLMETPKAIGNVFNIGSQQEIKIKYLAMIVKMMTSSKSEIKYVPFTKAYDKNFEDMAKRIPDVSKLKKLIKYVPEHNIEYILERVIDYYKDIL